MIAASSKEDGRVAWYWSFIGSLDMARQLGLITEERRQELYEKAKKMTSGVPCTACRYCTTYCPKGIDIPYILNQYNQITFNPEGLAWYTSMAIGGVEKGKKPWDCIACGSCKEVCPQQIDIPRYLEKLSAKLKEA